MPRVFIPSQLRDLTDGHAEIDLPGECSLREVVSSLDEQFPGVAWRLCQGDQLLPGLQASIDHVSTRVLSARVAADSEVHFLPAIGGG